MSLGSLLTRAAGRPVRVRLVSPVPPYEPEPHEDEPFAPVYSHAPLGPREGRTSGGKTLRGGPDPIVFGRWSPAPDWGAMTVTCPRCDVKQAQAAGPKCWYCGRRT